MNSKNVTMALFPPSNPVSPPVRYRSTKTSMLKLTSSLLFFSLTISSGQAQTPELDFIESSLSVAIASNPKIHAAKAMLEATREKYDQRLAELLPDVSLRTSQTHRFVAGDSSSQRNFFDGESGSSGEESTNEVLTRIGMQLNQPLFKWSSVLALRQSESIIASSEEELNSTTQSVLLETLQAVINFMLTENVAKLAESNLTFTRRNLDATRTRRKAGHLTRTDVDQATARVSSAEAELIHAKNEAMVARARFEEVVGIAVPKKLHVPDAPEHLLQGSLQELFAKIDNRPDIKSAKLRLESNDYNVDIEKSGHLPMIDFSASATTYRGGTGEQVNQESEYNIAVQLSLPLFSGGKTLSRTREAVHIRTSGQAELDRIQKQAMREVNQAYLEMHSAKATVKSAKAAFKFYKEALKGMQEEFRAGFRTVIDLLESQNQLFRSETDLVKNRYELLSSQYQLLYTTGQLTLKTLQPAKNTQPTSEGNKSGPTVHTVPHRHSDIQSEDRSITTIAENAWKNLPLLRREDLTQLTLRTPVTPVFAKSQDSMQPTTIDPTRVRTREKQQPSIPTNQPRTKNEEQQVDHRGLKLTWSLGPRSIFRPLTAAPVLRMKKATKGGRSYFIHVGSFKKAESVVGIVAKLVAAGQTPIQEKVEVRGDHLVRVFYGPFETNAKALEAKARLDRKEHFVDSVVVQMDLQTQAAALPSVSM